MEPLPREEILRCLCWLRFNPRQTTMKHTSPKSSALAVVAAVLIASAAQAEDAWPSWNAGARFCLYVHLHDAAREWAYDRQSSIGQLDKGLDEARAGGWTVVSMKDAWKRVFAFEK